jgi:hypothetical protein
MLAGKLGDPRTAEALDIVETKRSEGGRWRSEGYYWRPPEHFGAAGRRRGSGTEVVDWGRGGPNEMITLNALRVLSASGRIQ